MLNFTVNPLLESAFHWCQHAVGAIVLPLNLFTFYLIYTKTPKHSSTYRIYLLNMQLWPTLMDLHLGYLFMPMPMFPLTGGYCNGALCRAGIPMHYLNIVFIVIIGAIFHSMGISIFYRLQLILPEGHPMRMGLRFIFFIAAFAIQMTSITLLFASVDSSMAMRYLEENHPAMLWMAGEDSWSVYDPADFPTTWLKYESTVILFVYPTVFITICVQLFRGLSKANFMSVKTRDLHRRTVSVLIAQVCIVCIFLVACGPVYLLSLFTAIIPHEVNLAFAAMVMFYSLAHSLVLIATTPAYRTVITGRLAWPRATVDRPLKKSRALYVAIRQSKCGREDMNGNLTPVLDSFPNFHYSQKI